MLPYNAVMAKTRSKTDKNPAPALYTLTLDNRQAKTVLTVLGAIELRMFEKGFELKPAQLKVVQQLRKNLSEQLGESDLSLQVHLAAALECAQARCANRPPTSTSIIASSLYRCRNRCRPLDLRQFPKLPSWLTTSSSRCTFVEPPADLTWLFLANRVMNRHARRQRMKPTKTNRKTQLRDSQSRLTDETDLVTQC